MKSHRVFKSKKKSIRKDELTEKILSNIQRHLAGKKHFPGELVPYLGKWAGSQLRHGVDLEAIADELNRLEIPTLSGIGAWNTGNLEYLMSKLI